MADSKPSIAIIGAGMGGLTAAATLRRAGFDVKIYEQARRFGRVGAGIQMMPNSMKVLRAIGLEDRLTQFSFAPFSHLNRDWDTGDVKRELPMPAELFGAPYLCMHRGDLHAALLSTVPDDTVHLDKKLVGLEPKSKASGSRSQMAPTPLSMRSLAPMACTPSCATSSSDLMHRYTKVESPTAASSTVPA